MVVHPCEEVVEAHLERCPHANDHLEARCRPAPLVAVDHPGPDVEALGELVLRQADPVPCLRHPPAERAAQALPLAAPLAPFIIMIFCM